MELNVEHSYYYQIQGQIQITGKKLGYFVVYSKQWIEIEIIKYNNYFWTQKMEKALET